MVLNSVAVNYWKNSESQTDTIDWLFSSFRKHWMGSCGDGRMEVKFSLSPEIGRF